MTFLIEEELAQDVPAREALLDLAMGANRKRKSSEKIRRGRLPADGLSLVARLNDDGLVATVRLWHVAMKNHKGQTIAALLLGPLAVHPDYKGCGAGTALMQAAIAKAKALGHGAILLVGDVDYYQRFGFSSALTRNLAMPGPYEMHRFQALELQEGYLADACGSLKATGKKIIAHHRQTQVA